MSEQKTARITVKKPKVDLEPLTDVELEMMTIIWKHGPCTVHQIIEHLPTHRKLAYTSVSTMVRILELKQFVDSKKDGRAHLYQAKVQKEAYEARAVTDVITKVFEGKPTALVRSLISNQLLTKETLEELKKMIEAGKQK
jgi:predicted transcriptional regulator